MHQLSYPTGASHCIFGDQNPTFPWGGVKAHVKVVRICGCEIKQLLPMLFSFLLVVCVPCKPIPMIFNTQIFGAQTINRCNSKLGFCLGKFILDWLYCNFMKENTMSVKTSTFDGKKHIHSLRSKVQFQFFVQICAYIAILVKDCKRYVSTCVGYRHGYSKGIPTNLHNCSPKQYS